MDKVFKALGDKTRREILDRLKDKEGLTLTELLAGLDMKRQSASQHLKLLVDANLIHVEIEGRYRRHYLNPIPILEIQNRWMDKFKVLQGSEIINLKEKLEGKNNE